MVKKRIVSVLILLIFVLGVTLSGISASGFGERKAVGNNAADENTEEVAAGIQWKLTFYERKDLRNSVYKVRELCGDSDLLERLETVKETEQEVAAVLDTPWAKAYCAFLEEVLGDNPSKTIPTGFRLVYIDDDDVPELLIMEDYIHPAGIKVCTYYQNRVVEIGEYGSMGQLNYAARRGRICGFFMAQGETFSHYYALDNGKAEEIAVFHTYPDLDYEDYSVMLYETDGESVTEALYNEKMRKLEGDDVYEYINYDAAIFVEDMENLKRALAQEIVAARLKDGLTPMQREAMEAYEDFLEEYTEEFMENHNTEWEDYEKYDDYKGARFMFLYLDDDEIPELAIATVPETMVVSLYTYDGLKVTEVGNFGQYEEIAYIEKEGVVLFEYDRYSHDHYAAYQVEEGEADKLLWIDEYWHWASEENQEEWDATYSVDGKDVPEAEYMTFYKRYKDYWKKARLIAYEDFFVMLDGNLKGNLNQAMEELLLKDGAFYSPENSIQGNIMSGDFSCLEDEDWESMQENYERQNDLYEWRQLDLNGDGIDDLILQEKETTTEDSDEHRILGIFACEENGARCVLWDNVYMGEFAFCGPTGELMFYHYSFGGMVDMEGYDHYYYDMEWNKTIDYRLVIWYIDSPEGYDYPTNWFETHPDMQEKGTYYRKYEGAAYPGKDTEGEVLTLEELKEIFRTEMGIEMSSGR